VGADPIGLDLSRAELILTAPNQGQRSSGGIPFPRAGPGRRAGSSTAGTHTHKGKKKHLLSLSEGMDLGRQQGSSLRNRCFSAFLVWPGGLPGRKKESPSRRRVNRAAAPDPAGSRVGHPAQGKRGRRQHMQRSAGGAGRQSPAQALLGLSASSQDKPGTEFSSLGRMGMAKRQSCWATHTQPLCTPPSERAGVQWRHPAAQRPRRRRGWTLPFSSKAKYPLPGDPPLPAGLHRLEPRKQPASEPGHCIPPRARAGLDPAGTQQLNTKHAPNPAMQPRPQHAPPPQRGTGIRARGPALGQPEGDRAQGFASARLWGSVRGSPRQPGPRPSLPSGPA